MKARLDEVSELLAILQDVMNHLQDRPDCREEAWVGQATVRGLAEALDCDDALRWPHSPNWVSPLAPPVDPSR